MKLSNFKSRVVLSIVVVSGLFIFMRGARTQDWFSTGINLGAPRIRVAVSEFRPGSGDATLVGLTQEFNQVLWNDLDNSGIFEMVNKSLLPLKAPQEPADVVAKDWTDAPVSSRMLVFGKTEALN